MERRFFPEWFVWSPIVAKTYRVRCNRFLLVWWWQWLQWRMALMEDLQSIQLVTLDHVFSSSVLVMDGVFSRKSDFYLSLSDPIQTFEKVRIAPYTNMLEDISSDSLMNSSTFSPFESFLRNFSVRIHSSNKLFLSWQQ